MKNILVIIPTYNERKNIKKLADKIFAQKIDNLDVLFIDDNSTDGTIDTINNLIKKNSNIFLIVRKAKMGIGSAHIDGLYWAYKNGYKKVITMDADLTHDPKDIKSLINKSDSGDLIIASRYLSKNSMRGWNPLRVLMTKTSHLIVTLILKDEFDASNAYRLYNLDKIPIKILGKIKSKHYTFFFESLYIFLINGLKVVQVPIILHSRYSGSSKMRFKDIFIALKFYLRFFWIDKTGYLKKDYVLKND
jgi:dolichol-phosphate mannosyltransferase